MRKSCIFSVSMAPFEGDRFDEEYETLTSESERNPCGAETEAGARFRRKLRSRPSCHLVTRDFSAAPVSVWGLSSVCTCSPCRRERRVHSGPQLYEERLNTLSEFSLCVVCAEKLVCSKHFIFLFQALILKSERNRRTPAPVHIP